MLGLGGAKAPIPIPILVFVNTTNTDQLQCHGKVYYNIAGHKQYRVELSHAKYL